MRRVLFFGSRDWRWTRPISRVFLDLRPESCTLYGYEKVGELALRIGEASQFPVRKPRKGLTYDDAYGFFWNDDDWVGSVTGMPEHRRLHLFVSERPQRKT